MMWKQVDRAPEYLNELDEKEALPSRNVKSQMEAPVKK
jgi:hypothetical protein